MLTGMPLREFDFLYAMVEKMCREEERERLSRRPGCARSGPDGGTP